VRTVPFLLHNPHSSKVGSTPGKCRRARSLGRGELRERRGEGGKGEGEGRDKCKYEINWLILGFTASSKGLPISLPRIEEIFAELDEEDRTVVGCREEGVLMRP